MSSDRKPGQHAMVMTGAVMLLIGALCWSSGCGAAFGLLVPVPKAGRIASSQDPQGIVDRFREAPSHESASSVLMAMRILSSGSGSLAYSEPAHIHPDIRLRALHQHVRLLELIYCDQVIDVEKHRTRWGARNQVQEVLEFTLLAGALESAPHPGHRYEDLRPSDRCARLVAAWWLVGTGRGLLDDPDGRRRPVEWPHDFPEDLEEALRR